MYVDRKIENYFSFLSLRSCANGILFCQYFNISTSEVKVFSFFVADNQIFSFLDKTSARNVCLFRRAKPYKKFSR